MKTHLLKLENDGVTEYQLVNNNEHFTVKGLRLFIPYKACIYKGVECAIISQHLNFYIILFEGKEIKTTSTLIELI